MKISKITKLLPVTLALALSIGCVNAAGEGVTQSGTVAVQDAQSSAKINYELTLPDYVRITENSTTKAITAKYGEEYANLTLDGTLTAEFQVITNTPRTVLLTSPSLVGNVPALYNYDTTNHAFSIVFVNTDAADFDTDSITSITTPGEGVSSLSDSPDAFAVRFEKVKVGSTHNNGDNATTTPITCTESAGTVTYDIPNGVSTLNFQSVSQIIANTFNTRDTMGLYKAQLVLTDGGIEP